MADTAALVVALSAQLTKFEKDMQKAGIMAERAVGDIENKFSKISPKISTSFFGNLFANLADRAISSVTQGIDDLISRMVELQRTATFTEQSLNFLYGLQQASKGAGAGLGEINAGIRAIASGLDQMQRGHGGPLKELFDFNPQALKGINRDALTLSQTLNIVAGIMRNAKTEIQAVEIGKKLGVPEAVVQSWEKYGTNLSGAVKKAQASAPDLDAIAEKTKLVEETWKRFIAGLGAGAIDAAANSINSLARATTTLAGIQRATADWMAAKTKGTFLEPLTKEMVQANKDYQKEVDKAQELLRESQPTFADRWLAVPKPDGAKPEPRPGTGKSVVPTPAAMQQQQQAAVESQYERTNKQISKRIELNEAEARTVGASVAVQEAARTEALLNLAAEQDRIPVTDELTRKIRERAEAAGIAAQKEADARKQFQELSAMSSQFGSLLSSSFADAVVEGKKLDEVFKDLTKSLLKMAINTTIMNLFNPGAGGQASPFLSLFGVGKNAGGTNNWRGGMSLVGEHGPELVNLPRGSQVIPADATRNMVNGGGGSITYAPAIDARGASVEAVARLARIIETDRAMFASRTVATIQQARRARVAGL